jgi:hypothetical protein
LYAIDNIHFSNIVEIGWMEFFKNDSKYKINPFAQNTILNKLIMPASSHVHSNKENINKFDYFREFGE